MAVRGGKPVIRITADADGVKRGVDQADGQLDRLEKSAHRAGSGMKKGMALGAAGVAAAGVAAAVALKSVTDAAIESEKSQAKLKTQLEAGGRSYEAHARQIDAVIQKHSQLAGVDDEDLQDAFTGILRSTGSMSTAMKDVGLVTDLMRGKHMDAAKAGDLLSKVHNGNVGALKRMGISVDPVTRAQDKLKDSTKNATKEQIAAAKEADKTATAQKGIAELQKRFAGQAEAYGKTGAGAQERFGVAVENLKEKLGAKLLPTVTAVTGKIADFVGGMESGKGAGGRFAANLSSGFEKARTVVTRVIDGIKTAVGIVKEAVSSWVAKNRGDIDSVISAFKTVGGFARTVFLGTVLPIVKRTMEGAGKVIGDLVHVIRGVVRLVSGLFSGDWAKAWSGAKEVASGAFKTLVHLLEVTVGNLWEIVKDLGPGLIKLIGKGLKGLGTSLVTGMVEGIQWAAENVPGKVVEVLKGLGRKLGDTVKSAIDPRNWFSGDGIGRAANDGIGRMIPAFGGGLMGARANMAPVAGIASRFGLGVSSGLRPGAITSSGNKSYHSTGEALDIAGTPAGMLGFFRFMKNTMGGALAELIHTPGGAGIRNGAPYTYGGQVAKDHFDHVHVAIDSGAPGVGDGIGQIRNLWVREGGRASVANMAAAISMAESGGNPSASHRNTDGTIDRGLWQINSRHGALSTFDRDGNARAAVQISGNGSNWNPWTVFKTGAYKRFLSGSGSSGQSAKGGSGSATGGSNHQTTYPGRSGPPTTGAQSFLDRLGAPHPTKGFTPEEQAARQALLDRAPAAPFGSADISNIGPMAGAGPYAPPTEEDFIQSAIARARLTDDKADDIAALTRLRDRRKTEMDAALADNDPRNDDAAISAFLDVKDSLDALTKATEDATRLQQERDSLLVESVVNQKRLLALAGQGDAILTATIAAISGAIGGKVGLGYQAAGTPGVMARY